MKIYIRDRILWGLQIGGEGARAYNLNKLWLWTPIKYSRKRYRGLMARIEREGLVQRVIIDGLVNYRLAQKGKQKINQSFPVLNNKNEAWDGFWRLVIFDVAEAERQKRDELRRELVKMGFGRLQNSIYISAFEFQPQLNTYLETQGLTSKAMLLEAKQKYLGDPVKLAAKVWQIEALSKGYQEIMKKLTTRFGIKESARREEWFKKIYEDYLKLAVTEPWLPKNLLPQDWPGEKAKNYILRSGVIRE
ncbi:MAG: PaaX family transcriptional regulator C-terminal domain-containing protein [Patescibacteria group bacterium]